MRLGFAVPAPKHWVPLTFLSHSRTLGITPSGIARRIKVKYAVFHSGGRHQLLQWFPVCPVLYISEVRSPYDTKLKAAKTVRLKIRN